MVQIRSNLFESAVYTQAISTATTRNHVSHHDSTEVESRHFDHEAGISGATSIHKEMPCLPFVREFKRIRRTQHLLDIPHVLMPPGNQDISRPVVRSDGISHALGLLPRAVRINL